MQTKPKFPPRLLQVELIADEVAEELNKQIRIIAATEGRTGKYIILDALRKVHPELNKLVKQELGN